MRRREGSFRNFMHFNNGGKKRGILNMKKV